MQQGWSNHRRDYKFFITKNSQISNLFSVAFRCHSLRQMRVMKWKADSRPSAALKPAVWTERTAVDIWGKMEWSIKHHANPLNELLRTCGIIVLRFRIYYIIAAFVIEWYLKAMLHLIYCLTSNANYVSLQCFSPVTCHVSRHTTGVWATQPGLDLVNM